MGDFVKKSMLLLCFAFLGYVSAMTASPILSRGKTVKTSGGDKTFLTDNKFSSQTFTMNSGSWVAINVGTGHSKIFFNWNDPAYYWSAEMRSLEKCNTDVIPEMSSYDIMTSANSTNGSDGQWTTALQVRGNICTARGHLVDFTGNSWVKMKVNTGSGSLDEIEVFDASKGAEDTWFFPGTSISGNTYKATPPAQDFADLVNKAHSGYNPAMMRGGIACITTTDMVRNLSKYLALAHDCHYWAIEQGTNDAWGGTNANVGIFKKNLQTIIDSCKKAGIEPIIARLLATNAGGVGWQIHQDYEKAIDSLTSQNKLIAGPDLYTWFLNHPSELNGGTDNVHPNATGAASIQRLWSEKMSALYLANHSIQSASKIANVKNHSITTSSKNGYTIINAKCSGTAFLFSTSGKLIDKLSFSQNILTKSSQVHGVFLVKFVSAQGIETLPMLNVR